MTIVDPDSGAPPLRPERAKLFLAKLMLFLASVLALVSASADGPTPEIKILSLPALEIGGRTARAHTQGLECVGAQYYVTARLESSLPNTPLLLRTQPGATRWDVWDIAPRGLPGGTDKLDHPGGLQSDGKRLWIPVAESVRHGRSVIRAFALAQLVPGQPAAPDFEFPVADHIGAVAVATNLSLVFGASWDTETVYVWDFAGHLQQTLRGPELRLRNLGAIAGPNGHAGLAVQDWKTTSGRLVASGLFKDPGAATAPPKSRLLVFTGFLEPEFACQTIHLPLSGGTELGREAMAITDGLVYFLPEDLGSTNRVFQMALPQR